MNTKENGFESKKDMMSCAHCHDLIMCASDDILGVKTRCILGYAKVVYHNKQKNPIIGSQKDDFYPEFFLRDKIPVPKFNLVDLNMIYYYLGRLNILKNMHSSLKYFDTMQRCFNFKNSMFCIYTAIELEFAGKNLIQSSHRIFIFFL